MTGAGEGGCVSGDAYRLSLILSALSKAMEVTTLADQLNQLEDATDPKLRRLA